MKLACLLGLLAATALAPAATLSAPTVYRGMCDASAAVSLSADFFAVANDEDNVLRVYRREPGGLPAYVFDMTAFLRIGAKSPEADMEASATVGDRVYWITSHGRNAKGKDSPNRERFFATTFALTNGGVVMKPVGRPYAALLDDLVAAPGLKQFNLAEASQRAPKEPAALNIEGLCSTPEGHLLIGFRNPIPQGRALLVPLLNAAEIVAGRRARFGDAVQIDLGGYGIRSMGRVGNDYFVIAGPFDGEGESRAYVWDGKGAPRHLADIRFKGLNPEGLAYETADGRTEFYVLSDDGTRNIDGVDCKRLTDPAQRRFRGSRIAP